jgi:hypothetical protein
MHEAAACPVDASKPAPARPPACPVCSGPLVPLRGFARCARCFYTLCDGCDPAGDEGVPAG